ncbi:FxsA family protein [Campylobacter sp. faydin G-24]|uniref:FxsA family protein n=1 Tax=Campylobacter anatolicus TaxID=2829105 RepID=A0ABS5HIL5_9BACT|nr:FxsA family protein [Campylobacter anatolicus]MBR8462729.1 FxsA family protein [Campylobacter anatolicus]MBR8464103.1 FxsA family protein [Campylobacter anatolicus]
MSLVKILFTPYIIVELIATYFFIISYGFFTLLLEILISGAIGLALIFRMGLNGTTNINGFLNLFANGSIVNTLSLGVAGFLLFMPGILSDMLGVAVLIASLFIKPKMQNMHNTENFTYYEFKSRQNSTKNYNEDDIIDVEVIDETRNLKDR